MRRRLVGRGVTLEVPRPGNADWDKEDRYWKKRLADFRAAKAHVPTADTPEASLDFSSGARFNTYADMKVLALAQQRNVICVKLRETSKGKQKKGGTIQASLFPPRLEGPINQNFQIQENGSIGCWNGKEGEANADDIFLLFDVNHFNCITTSR